MGPHINQSWAVGCFQRRCGACERRIPGEEGGWQRSAGNSPGSWWKKSLSPKDGWSLGGSTASTVVHLLQHLILFALYVHSIWEQLLQHCGWSPFLGNLRKSSMNYSPHHLELTTWHLSLFSLYYLKFSSPPATTSAGLYVLPGGISLWSCRPFQAMATALLLWPSQLDKGISRNILCESPGFPSDISQNLIPIVLRLFSLHFFWHWYANFVYNFYTSYSFYNGHGKETIVTICRAFTGETFEDSSHHIFLLCKCKDCGGELARFPMSWK